MVTGIELRTPARVRAGPGARWPRLLERATVLAVILVCLLGARPECASGEPFSISTGLGISIRRAVKIRYSSPFDPNPRYMAGMQTAAAEEPVGSVEAAEIVVTTNDVKWGVAVRLELPKGSEQLFANSVAQCRLLTLDGKLISERFVDAPEVFLEGNGVCGEQRLYLEVSGHAEAFGIEALTEDVVGVAGWSSREEK